MRSKKSLALLCSVTVILALVVGCAPEAPPEPAAPPAPEPKPPEVAEPDFDAEAYFQGQSILLIVPWGPGGAVDLFGRSIAPYLERYIPGNPSVAVENRPGAGSVTAMNHFGQAVEGDGFTLLTNTSSAELAYMMPEVSAADYDLLTMTPLGGVGEGNTAYASTARISGPEDLYQSEEELFAGIRGPASSGTFFVTSAMELFEANWVGVEYPGGTAEARTRIFAGESDVFTEFLWNYYESVHPEVETGTVVPLFQTGLLINGEVQRDPRGEEIPTALEAYEEVTGQPASGLMLEANRVSAGFNILGRSIMVPPGTPDHIVEVLAEAVEQALSDPEWQADTLVHGEPFTVLTQQEAQQVRETILDAPPELMDWHLEVFERVTQ